MHIKTFLKLFTKNPEKYTEYCFHLVSLKNKYNLFIRFYFLHNLDTLQKTDKKCVTFIIWGGENHIDNTFWKKK